MKTILISFVLFALSFNGYTQNFQATFTGLDEVTNKYVPIDSILIKNLTQECDTILYGNDTVLALFPIGIEELNFESQSFNIVQNYPNPFRSQTTFGLQVLEKEQIVIRLYTILGKQLVEYESVFDPGVHLFSCKGIRNNFYILTASNGKITRSVKLISSSSNNSNSPKITHIAYSSELAVFKKKSLIQKFVFSYGDQLEITGYASGYIPNVLTVSPQINTDYIFMFEAPFSFTCGDTLIDERDGKAYQTIEIGTQCWISKNLNIGSMIDGSQNQQDNTEIEKYCYNNIESNCEAYGGLYQWDEMMQYDTNMANQGICPKGWRLPSETEWDTLVNILGGSTIAGEALMSGGSSGFEALLAGKRESDGSFSNMDLSGYFSNSLQADDQSAWYRYLLNGDSGFYEESSVKANGYSVRCVKGYPNRINPFVVVIDTNVYLLLSDSLELAQGIYRYQVLNKPKQDTIGSQNIIIGITNEGYLREVIEASQTGDELILNTVQATMDDIWESGEFNFNLSLGDEKQKDYSQKFVVNYLVDGVSIKEIKDGSIEFYFNNVTLFEDGPVKISLPTGYCKLNPEFDCGMGKSLFGGLEYFYLRADNAMFEASAKLQLTLTEELQQQLFEKDIASYSRFYVLPTFPPIVMVANVKLMARDIISSGVAFTATTGYTQAKSLDFGLLYHNNKWGGIWNYQTIKDSVHSLEYNVMVNLTNRLSLIPQISFKFYGIIGPFFEIDLYKKYEAKLSLFPPNNWDMGINLGISAKQVMDATFIRDDMSYEVFNIGPFELPIWNFPDSVIYIKGNNQTGEANETLPDSLIIQVVDNFGYGWPMIPAVYEVTNGNGSLSDSIVETSDNGYARTEWTLGSGAGQNTVKALVRKADNTNVKESPFEFNAIAYAPEPCPGIPTVIYEGQTYNTIQIGDQCWLKENLNVGTMIIGGTQNMANNDTLEKFCYYNNPENCEIYGALYTWFEMMQWSEEEGVQGICPEGWHLPTDDEWKILEGTADSQYPIGDPIWDLSDWRGYDAGYHLKSTNLWDYGNGDDEYGFSSLPGGILPVNPYWSGLNDVCNYWSSSMVGPFYARARLLTKSHDDIKRLYHPKDVAISVRCLQD